MFSEGVHAPGQPPPMFGDRMISVPHFHYDKAFYNNQNHSKWSVITLTIKITD